MEKFKVPSKINTLLLALSAIGIATLAVGFIVDPSRAWAGLLVMAFYLMTIALFGGFFTSYQFLAGAKWSVVLRRVPEMMVNLLPVAAILVVGVIYGIHELYEWSHEDLLATDHILQKKSVYLNTPFFIARLVFYFAVWYVLGSAIKKVSIKQDETKDPKARGTLTALSVGYMLCFAYFLSLAAIDLVMSLEPHWQTTMFPIYAFAGLAYTGFGTLIILTTTIQKNGGLVNMNAEHYHDIGKFMFGFTVFWAYIAFAQHMLTWYASLPEETIYLERRLTAENGWALFTALLWFFHFVPPFFMLLSSKLKRTPEKLVRLAWFIVFMGFVDVVWMVYGGIQHHNVHGFPFSWMEIGIFLGCIGLTGYVVLNAYSKVNPEPVGDPYYEDSLHFHQSH